MPWRRRTAESISPPRRSWREESLRSISAACRSARPIPKGALSGYAGYHGQHGERGPAHGRVWRGMAGCGIRLRRPAFCEWRTAAGEPRCPQDGNDRPLRFSIVAKRSAQALRQTAWAISSTGRSCFYSEVPYTAPSRRKRCIACGGFLKSRMRSLYRPPQRWKCRRCSAVYIQAGRQAFLSKSPGRLRIYAAVYSLFAQRAALLLI